MPSAAENLKETWWEDGDEGNWAPKQQGVAGVVKPLVPARMEGNLRGEAYREGRTAHGHRPGQ